MTETLNRNAASVVLVLNNRWAVLRDGYQWMLAERRRPGDAMAVRSYEPRKFIVSSDHLLRRIGEMCGRVRPDATAEIRAWPEHFMVWHLRVTDAPPAYMVEAEHNAAEAKRAAERIRELAARRRITFKRDIAA